uniref:protein-tyrosine-phosphatase n=1 Tax=Dunaliella tertiolecta TaxID=3047 RepID=A0A7S3QUC6_DUNTE
MTFILIPNSMASEASEISEVEPGLFLGSLSSLAWLEALSITHVVSVVNFSIDKDLSAYRVLHLPIKDSEETNLLSHLPGAFCFIHEALSPADPTPPGRVLVHCQGGVSRSASIVAAYLMKAKKWSREQALQHIKRARPTAYPNDGFLAQLDLFSEMRCSLDLEHPVYRMWCVEQVGMQREEEGWVDPDAFCTLPEDTQAASKDGCTLYRCRKCRRLVATSRQVLPVEAAMGHRIFRSGPYGSTTRRTGQAANQPPSQQPEEGGASLFVEPIAWMAESVVGAIQGKLYCPGCNSRMGSFNWSGISNERGQWVVPAFQLHMSKLDVMHPPRPLAAMATVAMPRMTAYPTATPQSAGAAAGHGAMSSTMQGSPNGVAAGHGAMSSSVQGAPNGADAVPQPAAATAALDGTSSCTAQGVSNVAVRADSSNAAVSVQGSGMAGGVDVGQRRACRTAWFDTLVLDCDGVLVDSERASCEALRRSILQVTGFDIPHTFPQDFFEVFGMDVRNCVAHFKQKFNRSDWGDITAIARSVQDAKEHHYKDLTEGGIAAFPGAAALIQRAKDLGMAVSVGSSGAPEKIQRNLSLSGLAPLLDPHHIVSAAYVAKVWGRGQTNLWLFVISVQSLLEHCPSCTCTV